MKIVYKYDTWLERINTYVVSQLKVNKDMLPSNKELSAKFEEFELDNWWYAHYKDFSRYKSWHYLYAGLNCFFNYSKNFAVTASQHLKDVKSVVDVGAGIGLSTMLLADLFPNAKIYYNNIQPSLQAEFFKIYKQDRIEILNEKEMMQKGPFDVLFASEYFEHFPTPLKQLDFLIDKVRFKRLVVSNSFNVKAYGHFTCFEEGLNPRQVSKAFNRLVRVEYDDLKIKVWNGRPKIYVRKEAT